jgi:1-acyl-sn-glycerol-3-phosphate acyltransferase
VSATTAIGVRPAAVPSAVRWLSVGLLAIPLLGGASLLALVHRRAGWRLLTTWTRWSAAIFGIETDLRDENAGGLGPPPLVFVQLNQASLSESFALPAWLPVPFHVLMNVEYALIPLLGWAHFLLGGVVVVRQWKWQTRMALKRCLRHLRNGRSVVLSIEGRRSENGALGPYKKGPAVLAIAAQVPIVPILVEGAGPCLPYGEWRVRPGRITITLLQAVETSGLSPGDRSSLVERLRALAESRLNGGGR